MNDTAEGITRSPVLGTTERYGYHAMRLTATRAGSDVSYDLQQHEHANDGERKGERERERERERAPYP